MKEKTFHSERMKILFMGTPDFAVPVLEGLIASSKHEVVAVVTQPDKIRGRKYAKAHGKATFSPVKEVAVREQIPVLQPNKIRNSTSVEEMKALDADVAVVVAYGQILSKEILDMPRYGCVNVHGSLLPRWRGAAPIQWSILSGDKKTGITTMQMDEGIDTGDILMTKEITIGEKETGGELFGRMSLLGSEVLLNTLEALEANTLSPIKQNDAQSTYAKMLTKELGELDFKKPAVELERTVRGLNPWPSAYTKLNGKTLKIWEADVMMEVKKSTSNEQSLEKNEKRTNIHEKTNFPGEIVAVSKDSFSIKTGQGNLLVKEVQLEGKKRMSVEDFLRGMKIETGWELH